MNIFPKYIHKLGGPSSAEKCSSVKQIVFLQKLIIFYKNYPRPLWPKKDSVIKYANIIPIQNQHTLLYTYFMHTQTHIHTYMYWLKALRGSSSKILIKLKPTFSKLIFTTLLFSQNIHHHLRVHTRVCYTVNFG